MKWIVVKVREFGWSEEVETIGRDVRSPCKWYTDKEVGTHVRLIKSVTDISFDGRDDGEEMSLDADQGYALKYCTVEST